MSSKYDLVRIIRRTQTVVSVTLFLLTMLFCWQSTGLKLTEIQISYWGSSEMEYGWLWNSIIVMLSISIIINNILFVKRHSRLKYKTIPYILFSLVSFCLLLVGSFNLEHNLLHDIPAWIYFFLYPLSIFTMAYLNRGILHYKEWFTHLIFSIIMIVTPLMCLSFTEGLGLSEIAHSLIVISWNVHTAFKRFDINLKTSK
jgi:hypothetical membrane protein